MLLVLMREISVCGVLETYVRYLANILGFIQPNKEIILIIIFLRLTNKKFKCKENFPMHDLYITSI